MADAIGRTLFRLFSRRKHLLEWVTAAQATSPARLDLGAATAAWPAAWRSRPSPWRSSWSARRGWLVGGVAVGRAVARGARRRARISRSRRAVAALAAPSPDDARLLRLIARRTWRYFETFVTAGDHMLPPDNFQEDPQPVLAHRTSPTNLGLYLLSVGRRARLRLDRHARGPSSGSRRRSPRWQRLQRFRGHFYNWYDTRRPAAR